MTERHITPSKITAWLDCSHYLTLRSRVDEGRLTEPNPTFGSFARLLQIKGQLHEDECLKEYEAEGKAVYRVPAKADKESFGAWVNRVGNPMTEDHDVIYQMPFICDGVRGVADFLERVQRPDGRIGYEPVDAKLTRIDAKPGHVLQLCFYADAIKDLTGIDPEQMHILLGSKKRQLLRVNEFRPYWRRLRGQLAAAVDAGPDATTAPEKCNHCEFCEFYAVCDQQWRDEDSLIFIPGIRRAERDALDIGSVTTLTELGELTDDLRGIRPPRQRWLVRQAALQVEARLAGNQLPHELIETGEDARLGHGFELIPQPDDGDVFDQPFDAVFCANMLHIAPWATCSGLMRGAARHLAVDGSLLTYGPYLEQGAPTSPGNLEFDRSLRTRNPAWGIRALEDVVREARAAGLQLHARIPMPANNLLLVFKRPANAGSAGPQT